MNKVDSKVKKTLVRNYEHKVKAANRKPVVRAMDSSDPVQDSGSTLKGAVLSEPTICSSAAIANYITDVKNTGPPPLTFEDLNLEKGEFCAKMTKKLNFHVNERIYRNLVELNSSLDEFKAKKEKRPLKCAGSGKRDLEPEIEDFCEDEKEHDTPPKIPAIKPKSRLLKTVENGQLHKLVASFEIL